MNVTSDGEAPVSVSFEFADETEKFFDFCQNEAHDTEMWGDRRV
jgi:hypothetical protein